MQGCGRIIIDEFESLKNSHVIFMVILLISSIGMLSVYLKSWCSSRPWNGGNSDHSLDIERVSLIDLAIDDLPRASTDVRKSAGSLRAASIAGTKPSSKPPPLIPSSSVGKGGSAGPGTSSKYKYASISK